MRISDWSSDVCSSDLRSKITERPIGGRLLPDVVGTKRQIFTTSWRGCGAERFETNPQAMPVPAAASNYIAAAQRYASEYRRDPLSERQRAGIHGLRPCLVRVGPGAQTRPTRTSVGVE